MNQTYPIALSQLTGQKVVVVGGGVVGERKVWGVIAAGAKVTLISPVATEQLRAWADDNVIAWVMRPYQHDDLAGATVAFAATNIRAVNHAIAQEAQQLGILCNVADAPDDGNFYSMGVIRHEGLVIAIGTDGASPRRAKQIRQQLEQFLRDQS